MKHRRTPARWCAPRSSGALDDGADARRPGLRLRGPDRGARRPDEALLDPRGTWPDPAAYDEAAADLAGKIQEHAAEMGS